jgi:hypothetical protein
MLKEHVVDRIRRLIAEGRYIREIHRITGVSRIIIMDIARGLRPNYQAIRQAKAKERNPEANMEKKRCAGCGHVVETPCRICRDRRAAKTLCRRQPTVLHGPDEPLKLELREKEWRRLGHLRALRRRRRFPGENQ